MGFLRRHCLLFLGLSPVVYLIFLDLEGRHATPFMKGFWLFGFICMTIYGVQRTRAFKAKVRSLAQRNDNSDGTA